MLRFVVEVVVPFAIIFAAVWYGIMYHLLKRRMAGLDRPELWLSRRERRAYARRQLQLKDDERTQKIIEQTTQQLLNPTNYLDLKGQPREK